MSDDTRAAAAIGPAAGLDDGAAAAVASTTPVAMPDAAPSGTSLEQFLPEGGAETPVGWAPGTLRSARVCGVVGGRRVQVLPRGQAAPVTATIAPEVDVELVVEAASDLGSVLVEADERGALVVVGTLATRRPRELHLRAGTITLEGDDEILLRSGRSAVRLRADGDVEVVGSRISASARGLFRIVGRLLRLN